MSQQFANLIGGMQSLGDRMKLEEEFAARRFQEAQARQMQDQALQRAEQEFDFRKQSRAEDLQHRDRAFELQERQFGLQEQGLGLKRQALEQKAQAGAFGGTSEFAQLANLAYQEELARGADDFTARQRAADRVLQSKQTPTMITNPETGRQEIINIPRQGIFGGQPNDPMQASRQAIAQQQEQVGVNPMQREELMNVRPEQTVFEAQGQATGPRMASGAGLRVLNAITFGVAPIDQAYEESKITVDNAKGMLRSFAQNPRFPEGERKAIEDRISAFNTSILKGPDAARAQLVSVDRYLQFLRNAALRDANNPRTEVKEANNYRQKIRDIDQLRAYMLGVGPGEQFQMPGQPGGQDDSIQQLIDMYAQ